ncbi:MAG: tryptophan--tRNA ligase [Minisyncoccota bacterium]
MKKTLLSGVKPTGAVHLGNYFGAMNQFVKFQDEYHSYIFVANYHALTSISDGELLRKLSLDIAIDYLAIGLDPKKTVLFLQSDVPEVTELAWIFNTITSVPYLMRAHAYKDAEAKNKEVTMGLFDYPVLMAADILMYGAHCVPVGFDQKQHIEIARDIAQKFNRIFGDTFVVPEPMILDAVKTVPGTDGRKMSKSYGNTIRLFATDDEIRKSVMSIPTDSKEIGDPKDPEFCHVFTLHELLGGEDLVVLRERYLNGEIGYKESKEILIEKLSRCITPLREMRKKIADDPAYVRNVLAEGGQLARAKMRETMESVRVKTGIKL